MTAGRGPTRALITALVTMLIVAGGLVFPSAAFAHHAEITATLDCTGKVNFTATAWNGPTSSSKTNSEIGVWYSTNGGFTYTRLADKPTYEFKSSNGYRFSDSFQLPGDASQVRIKVQAVRYWANGAAPGEPRYTSNITKPNCPGPQECEPLDFLVKFENNHGSFSPEGGDAKGVTVSPSHISSGEVKQITWTSVTPIDKVVVKGGPTSNVFTFDEATAGGPHGAPSNKEISHVTFCFDPGTHVDVKVTKTDSPDPVAFGDEVTYTIAAKNLGPGKATAVVVEDVLPGGAQYVSSSSAKGSCTFGSGKVTCNVGDLNKDETATVTIKVTLEKCGEISNTATVRSNETDSDHSNNSSTTKTNVDCDVDLKITKTDSPDPVVVGGTITYSIGVQNLGQATATGVTVADQLPDDVSYQSATASQGACSFGSGTVTCALGSLAGGASAIVTIVVEADRCTHISNTATVGSNEVDANPSDNSATAGTTVEGCFEEPDLEIVKTDHIDPVMGQGGSTTYSIAVSNVGAGSATGVEVTDVLQSGVWYDSISTTKGTCSRSGATITCDIGDLASGETVTITLVVTLEDCGELHNTATVSANETESNTANNSSTATTTVECGGGDPDLEITKVDNMDPAPAGSDLIYTVTVRNVGTATAHNVVVTDTIQHSSWRLWEPPTASQGSCTPGDADTGDVIVCELGDILAGGAATVSFKVKARLCDPMTNTAVVSADEIDPTPSNNSATETTLIDGQCEDDPDMSITTQGPKKARIGDVITYTLDVFQGGPEYGTGITVVNRLDPDVDFVSVTASQGACTQHGQRIHCDLGEMDVFESAWVKVTGIPTKSGTSTNRAEVDVNEFDEDLTNNVTEFDTKVRAPKTKSKRFVASDDASVYKKGAKRKLGKMANLEVDKRSPKRFLTKFDVKRLKGRRIMSATLRLYNVDRSPHGGAVHGMTDSSWNERTVTWRSAPGYSRSQAGSFGRVEPGKWYEVDVTDLVLGEGAVSFTVTSSDPDGADYASRNGKRRFAPQLVVTLIDETTDRKLMK